jgi:L-threonylcarbamoyladenylate synthase
LFLTNNIEVLLKTLPRSGTGILSFKNLYPFILIPENRQEILSYTGNLEEAAHNLYKALHRLDSLGLERIIAESVPNTGLGIAINDRLSRSTQKTSINDDDKYAKQKNKNTM